MNPQDVIRKKRDGGALSRDEIAFFVRGVIDGSWADYQASALLMAIFLKGMSPREQQSLTEEMLNSGERLEWSDIGAAKVDKHSTGGVGDKTSLVLAPVVAALGLCVPMISGRSLGHTGGTLDKLEAIPGFRVNLAQSEFRAVLREVGFAMMGQTAQVAPADRRLYALRDATATIEAIPLIVASIMSKKLAAGLDALVLDVKSGSGAFMRHEEEARRLARALVETGNSCGVRTLALITDMNQPLGRAVGNALETRECLDILRGEVDERTRPVSDLSLELAARMVVLARAESSLEMARIKVRRALDSGAALERFRACVEAQGGDARVCDRPSLLLPLTLKEVKVESPRAGFVTGMDVAEIGHAVGMLGGGRLRVEDTIDRAVGFLVDARIGDHLADGEALGLLYYHDESLAKEAAARIQAAYELNDEPTPPPALIKEVIN